MQLDTDQAVLVNTLVERYKRDAFGFAQILPCMTGFGKSIISGTVAKHFYPAFEPFVVCPKTLIPMWEDLFKQLGIKPLAIMSYNQLSGKKDTGIKHPYLQQKDKEFRVTKAWNNLKGVFLICDESQAVKNRNSKRSWALFALLKNNSRDKVLYLTASAIDKKENWVSMYRNLGIIQHSQIVKRQDGKVKYKKYGLGDVFALAPEALVRQVKQQYEIKSKFIPHILMYLWDAYFREKLVVPVKDVIYTHPDTGVVINKKLVNHFVTLDEEGKGLVAEARAKLAHARIVNNDNRVNVAQAQSNFAVVQLALMDLCKAKVNTIVKHTTLKLKANSKQKVIIVCPFIGSQNAFVRKLRKYKPVLLLNGKTKNRQEVMNKFNEANTASRVLVMSNEMGEGISLHDTDGRFPRTVFIIPTYNFLKVFQCAGRTYRRGIKSDTDIYIVYSNDGVVENILVNALAKTEIASSVLIPGSGRLYPGEYDYEIEACANEKELRERLEEERQQAKALHQK